jgi:hypothetical protein
MNKNIVGIVVLLLVFGAFLTVYYNPNLYPFEIVGDEDVTTDTIESTQNWWCPGCTSPHTMEGRSDTEILDQTWYAKTWAPDDQSQDIELNPQAAKPTLDGDLFWLPGYANLPIFSKYFWNISVYNEQSNEWEVWADHTGITPDGTQKMFLSSTGANLGFQNWDTSYLYWESNWEDVPNCNDDGCECRCESPLTEAAKPSNHPNFNLFPDINDWYHLTGVQSDEDWNAKCPLWSEMSGVYFKGPLENYPVMKVSLCSYVWWYDAPPGQGAREHGKIMHWVTDFAYLREGSGDISITPSGHSNTNHFEVGETMNFKVKTGWSSYTNPGGDNWRLTIHQPDGEIATNIVVKDINGNTVNTNNYGRFYLPDDLNYKNFYIDITNDMVMGNHQWYLELYNTITPHAYTYIYYVNEGMADCGPVNTEMSVDIVEGVGESDTAEIELTAYGNTNQDCLSLGATGDVAYFILHISKNGVLQTDVTVEATHTYGGNEYTASYDYIVPWTDDAALGITAKAYDSGDNPGSEDTDYVQTGSTGNYILTVIVTKDGYPAYDAIVTVKETGMSARTSGDGSCLFSLAKDVKYTITATYEGESATRSVFLDDNKELSIPLSPVISIIAIILSILIFAVALVVAIILPLHISWKILIIVIAGVVSLLLFLILSGILYFI